jgi:hypothetical protein
MPIHTPISLKIPLWVQKVLVKLMKAFLWSSTESVQNGKCLLAWSRGSETIVYLGGLGVLDLEVMGHALRTRWLWFKRIDPGRPWAGLLCKEDPATEAFFKASIIRGQW